tara:strand:+ start:12487 stop:13287 length:801 start_codon:yes stop_codon:yes gene_type:complete
MKNLIIGIMGSVFSLGVPVEGETSTPVDLPNKENFYLVLLAGQSNMAGRGIIEEPEKLPNPRVLALGEDGKWRLAVAPIHFDKKVAGVGLASSFAEEIAEKYPNVTIGLIPAACGGSGISTWKPGGYHSQTKSHPWDDAIARARVAMNNGVLKGILWHQGESDGKPGLAEAYEENLQDLFQRFRTEFNAPELPIVLGQLGQFPAKPWDKYREQVNAAHIAVSTRMEKVAFVTSDGLTPNSDIVHFDTRSLRIFGKRYAEAYLKLVD